MNIFIILATIGILIFFLILSLIVYLVTYNMLKKEKRKLLLIILAIIFFLIIITGIVLYSLSAVVNKPLSQEEIIQYVEDEIKKETGIEVSVKIVNEEHLKVCTNEILKMCLNKQYAIGAKSYELEITNLKNNTMEKGTYTDGYALNTFYGKRKIASKLEYENLKLKEIYIIKKEFIKELVNKVNSYYIHEDKNNSNEFIMFVYETNYYQISDLLDSFDEILTEYNATTYVTYNVYFYKDKKAFIKSKLDSYPDFLSKNKEFTHGKDFLIKYTKNFVDEIIVDEERGNYIYDTIDDNYEYLVYWYNANSYSPEDSNRAKLKVLGVLEQQLIK